MRSSTLNRLGVSLAALLGAVLFVACGGFGPGMSDYSYDVSGGYRLVRSSAHEIKVVPIDGWGNKTPYIPSKVVEIAWNETFILAKQQNVATGQYRYWILSVDVPAVLGPLTYEEFQTQRRTLQIPESLKLRSVETFVR